MKLVISLLVLTSLAFSADLTNKDTRQSNGSLDKRVENLEVANDQRIAAEKQYDSFFDHQKDVNLEQIKLINDQKDIIEALKRSQGKTNEVTVLRDENDRLRNRVNSLESAYRALDDKNYKLEQRLSTIERKVR